MRKHFTAILIGMALSVCCCIPAFAALSQQELDDFLSRVYDLAERHDQLGDSTYILPDSDSRYYTAEELSGMTLDDLRKARNEIYARHGRIFDSTDLDTYFRGKTWYTPTFTDDQFSDDMLNDYEKANAITIQGVEEGIESAGAANFDKSSIYGFYKRYDTGMGVYVFVQVSNDGTDDYIQFNHAYRTASLIYYGKLEQINGNVFQININDSPVNAIITFQGDGTMSVEFADGRSYERGGLMFLPGTYSPTEPLDMTYTARLD